MNEPATVRVAHVEGRPPRQAALYWLALGTFAIGKRPHRADDPRIVEETRQYLRDFERMAERGANRHCTNGCLPCTPTA